MRGAVLALLLLACCGRAGADFSFALLGDAPYNDGEEAAFVEMLRRIDREDVAFVVHVGDFKNGWSSCGDPVFEQRHALFDTSAHAFVYVPGDNEWTDCHRLLAGGYEPQERLAALRARFFREAKSLGRAPLAVTRQSDGAGAPAYPEHLRWRHDGVVFLTLNVPGGDNNARQAAESAARTAAALRWLREGFALASRERARGVVVLMQANPFLRAGGPRRNYQELVAALAQETAAFDGAVLLGHGDTHIQRVDHPLRDAAGKPLANFTRAEVFGSPEVGWLRVRVTVEGGRAAFAVTPLR